MVGGLLEPSAGSVYFETNEAGVEPVVATVFQEIGLFPWRTASENIRFGLEELGLSADELSTRLAHYISLVGLSGFEDSYPHQLSGGMRQRAGIARALAVRPDLLLMDEPFSALDAQTRQIMQEELLRIWNESKLTTLYVTHNIAEAVYLADRIVVLSRRPGRINTIIDVDMPRFGRDDVSHAATFNGYISDIWGLIRKDAEDAVKEGAE